MLSQQTKEDLPNYGPMRSKVRKHPSDPVSTSPSLHDYLDSIILGDCGAVMQQLPANSIDLILTDPPYLINYHSRDGCTIAGDTDDACLVPAFSEAFRVLKSGGFCVSFYGWSKADRYLAAWRKAGFRPVGHLVWVKSYASASLFLQYVMSRLTSWLKVT